ncbi:hypothetical protein IGI04_026034 [Brassica rapa subsp. trilocularis]|uniref:Transposase MuDR plant domain-containing protein n=1 Tax=Brassica rapa subsp. trilocularis TaxID=1813537 RepID=A0ABQ7KW39_BRACM|nr:hypothetical protein IGI04_026034 [Brassica rapa subsp. trilocularis]
MLVGSSFLIQVRRGMLFFVEDDIKYEDFLRMVCEDYNMISETKAVELAYMLPKRILEQMASKTPSMFLSNDRNLENFITLSKTDVLCVYVSFLANKGRQDLNRNQKRVVRQNAFADFGSFGNVQYKTLKPSLETMKPSQLRKTETIKYGDIFSGKNGLIMKLRKLSVLERFDFSIKKSLNHLFYGECFVPGCSWKIRASTMSR